MQEPELIISSRTQSPETIAKILGEDGFEAVNTTVLTDQPAEPAPNAGAPPAAEATPSSSSVPSPDPGGQPAAAAPGESETRTDPEPVQPQAQPEPKKEGGFKRKLKERDARIGELENQSRAKDQEIENLKRQLAERSAAPAPKADPEAPKPEAAPAPKSEPKPKPKLDDFADADDPYLAYQEALVEWKFEEMNRQQKEAETREQPKPPVVDDAARRAAEEGWNSQLQAAKAKHADWDEAINKDHGKPICNPIMTDAIQSLEDGAERIYWLATHPEAAHRIHNLTAAQPGDTPLSLQRKFARAAFEIGRIDLGDAASPASRETRAEAAPQTNQPPVQQQQSPAAAQPKPKPVPPTPVGGRGTPGYRTLKQMSEAEIRAMDLGEYRKRREAGE